MSASCVKNISPTHLQTIPDLLLHCAGALQPTSIGFLKISALHDVPFTFYVEIISIILERPWAVSNPFEEKRLTRNERIKFAVLEQQLQRYSTED